MRVRCVLCVNNTLTSGMRQPRMQARRSRPARPAAAREPHHSCCRDPMHRVAGQQAASAVGVPQLPSALGWLAQTRSICPKCVQDARAWRLAWPGSGWPCTMALLGGQQGSGAFPVRALAHGYDGTGNLARLGCPESALARPSRPVMASRPRRGCRRVGAADRLWWLCI